MAEVRSGIRNILAHARVYDLFDYIIGGPSERNLVITQYIKPEINMKILDLGCGPGTMLEYLPQVEYHGIDISANYIESATQKYGHRATFECCSIEKTALKHWDYYDLVLAMGVLHHLDDAEAQKLFDHAFQALKQGGRLVTGDPTHSEDQSWFSRKLVSCDRGQNIRTSDGYAAFAEKKFSNIQKDVRHDFLRIPYTHCMLICIK